MEDAVCHQQIPFGPGEVDFKYQFFTWQPVCIISYGLELS